MRPDVDIVLVQLYLYQYATFRTVSFLYWRLLAGKLALGLYSASYQPARVFVRCHFGGDLFLKLVRIIL